MDSTERKKDVHNNQARSAAGVQGAAANVAAGEFLPASSPPPHQEVVKSFGDLPLSHEILSGIAAAGFETPTAIQQRAIGPLMAGRDVLAQPMLCLLAMLSRLTACMVAGEGRGKQCLAGCSQSHQGP